jgi:hypothetical protein
MIRPMTLLSMIAAAGAGLYLYQVKHSVAQLDRELRSVHRQTEQARERTQVLRAEWALLNEPERLRQVAQRHLPLEAMAPTQFVRMHEMDRRLPAARAFAGQASLFAPVEPPGDGRPTALALAEQRGRAAAPPAEPAAAPAAPAAPAPVVVAAAAVPEAAAAPEPGPARPAAAEPAARPQPAPRVAAASRPARPAAEPAPPVRTALHVPRPAPAQPIQRVAAPAPVAPPQITSVLAAGGPALAPPVPIARAAAATLSGSTR